MKNKLFAFLSVLILASMVLAACGPAAPATPAATEPGEQPPAATEPPTTGEFTCDDPIGCVDIAPGDPVHIAYGLVVAGPNSSLGIDSRNGIEIAIEDIGSEILGHPIQFDGQDTGCDAAPGQAAGTALAADPTIVAVIGTSCSSEARVAVPLLADAGFVVVSPSNTAPDLTAPGSENNHVPAYARTAHNDNLQGRIAAEYAYNELGVTNAATIHDGSIYADQLQQVFAARFQELGGTISAQEAVAPEQTDMSAVLTSIAAGEPGLIYFPIFMPAGAFIIRQAKQTAGLEEIHLMGADGLFSQDVIEGAGDDGEGFQVSSPAIAGAAYEEFVAKYQEKFGELPISIFHAHAYDAFMIAKNAIEAVAVQDADGTLHIPRGALRDAVIGTTNYSGLIGSLTCNETIEPIKYPGDCSASGIGVYEYHAGEYPPELVWTSGE